MPPFRPAPRNYPDLSSATDAQQSRFLSIQSALATSAVALETDPAMIDPTWIVDVPDDSLIVQPVDYGTRSAAIDTDGRVTLIDGSPSYIEDGDTPVLHDATVCEWLGEGELLIRDLLLRNQYGRSGPSLFPLEGRLGGRRLPRTRHADATVGVERWLESTDPIQEEKFLAESGMGADDAYGAYEKARFTVTFSQPVQLLTEYAVQDRTDRDSTLRSEVDALSFDLRFGVVPGLPCEDLQAHHRKALGQPTVAHQVMDLSASLEGRTVLSLRSRPTARTAPNLGLCLDIADDLDASYIGSGYDRNIGVVGLFQTPHGNAVVTRPSLELIIQQLVTWHLPLARAPRRPVREYECGLRARWTSTSGLTHDPGHDVIGLHHREPESSISVVLP